MATGAKKSARGQGAAGPSPSAAVLVNNLTGKLLQLPLELIDEDPDQPRQKDSPGFSASRLAELAATISARGVKTPISVRDHPVESGRYLINHGARRFRASKLAGAATIPAFIDNDYADADQVIENLQRNELTPREIADYIGRQLAKGMKKAEIAKSIGKSAAFVTQHVTLLDLPAPIAAAFSSGRVRDVTVISELVRAYKSDRIAVTDWLRDEDQEITRGAVATLREFLEVKVERTPRQLHDAEDENDDLADDDGSGSVAAVGERLDEASSPRRSLAVHVTYKKQPAILLHQRRPAADGHGWIRLMADSSELEVSLDFLRLVAIKERV